MSINTVEDVVQEFELHQLLVKNLDCLPKEMRSKPKINFFAWASELRLHDAGKDGGDGWADLLIADELGKSWIVELKLSTSNELNANVWKQLIRYRDASKRMTWGDIQNINICVNLRPSADKKHPEHKLRFLRSVAVRCAHCRTPLRGCGQLFALRAHCAVQTNQLVRT